MNYISKFNEWVNSDNNYMPEYSKDEFIESKFPFLNESKLEGNQKDILYAMYEAHCLFENKQHWFNIDIDGSNKPIILQSNTHSIICFNNEFFSITNESFHILFSENIYENIFSDAWNSVSNFFSDAWGGIKSVGDKIGDWAKELSDGAKAATGFIKLSYDYLPFSRSKKFD